MLRAADRAHHAYIELYARFQSLCCMQPEEQSEAMELPGRTLKAAKEPLSIKVNFHAKWASEAKVHMQTKDGEDFCRLDPKR